MRQIIIYAPYIECWQMNSRACFCALFYEAILKFQRQLQIKLCVFCLLFDLGSMGFFFPLKFLLSAEIAIFFVFLPNVQFCLSSRRSLANLNDTKHRYLMSTCFSNMLSITWINCFNIFNSSMIFRDLRRMWVLFAGFVF